MTEPLEARPATEWVPDETPIPQTIEDLLDEREKTYGSFAEFSEICQEITAALRQGNWPTLDAMKCEALEMIAHKIARILNGDPDYIDNWIDICGYSQLVVNELRCQSQKTPS